MLGLAAANNLMKRETARYFVAAEMEIGVGCKENLVKNCGAFECRKPEFLHSPTKPSLF